MLERKITVSSLRIGSTQKCSFPMIINKIRILKPLKKIIVKHRHDEVKNIEVF